MSADKPKLEFFDDIKSQLVLILAGIVSLATVIPAFLNSIAEMLGWDNIRYGYYLFVFLYFVLPYLFYFIYCSIHDNVGYQQLLSSKRLVKFNQWKYSKIVFAIGPPLLALIYLVWPQCPAEEIASMFLYFSAVICCIYFGTIYWKTGGVHTEFRIIACAVIIVFAFFLGNTLKNISGYSTEAQNKAFGAYQIKNVLNKDFISVLDSMRREAYKCRIQAAIQKPSLETTPLKGDGCTGCGISDVYDAVEKIDGTKTLTQASLNADLSRLKTLTAAVISYDQRLVKLNDTTLFRVEEIYQACAYLGDYALAVQRKQMSTVNGDWARLLQNLQFKSMIWFQFLILLGLCLWLKMQMRLRSLSIISYKELEEETTKTNDNINQVKSLVLLLFVLTVPWLRRIDANDIAMERPFLNISLSGLANGIVGPAGSTGSTNIEVQKTSSDTTRVISIPFIIHTVDTVTKIRIDTIWFPYPIFQSAIYRDSVAAYKRDPILDVIKRNTDIIRDTVNFINNNVNSVKNTVNRIQDNVKVNQGLIKQQARRTIGNPSDRKGF